MYSRSRVRFVREMSVIGFLLASQIAGATVITLAPSRDITLYESSSGTISNGSGTAMFTGRNSQTSDSIRRAVIAFDIAGQIPAGSTVNSVTLTLSNSAANAGDAVVELRRLIEDWGEGTSAATGGQGSGAPAAPGDATWLHAFYPSVTWSQPGGVFDSDVSSSVTVGAAGLYTWHSTARLIADVQAFVNQPNTNFGWLLLGDEATPSSAKRFSTHEETDPSLRPLLTVEYTSSPEPASLVLLLLGGITIVSSRRTNARRGPV